MIMDRAEEFEIQLGENMKRLRIRRGLTLDQLAQASGVSRAMISRVERGEASPTAALLARLCAALGTTLSTFFAGADTVVTPLCRAKDQIRWRDPESGYLRRSVSPPGVESRTGIVEVEFPPGAEVRFPGSLSARNQTQYVWVLEGEIEVTVGDIVYRLSAADCLFMNVADVHAYRNRQEKPARYAVIISVEP